MLEQKDLDLLKDLVKSVVDERIERSESKLESLIGGLKETQDTMLKTQGTMQNDIRMLKETQDTMLKTQGTMQNDIRMLKKTQNTILEEVDDLKQNQNFILVEIGRTQNYLEKRINKVERKLDEMDQFYRITKLENSATKEFIRICDNLTERVERLERKMA